MGGSGTTRTFRNRRSTVASSSASVSVQSTTSPLSRGMPPPPMLQPKPCPTGRRHRNAAMLLGTPLIVLFFSVHRQQTKPQQRTMKQYARKHQTQLPRVCSHQLLNPPPFSSDQGGLHPGSSSTHSPPPDGSLDAMTALWYNGGVTCFDVDVVVLSDGSMVAGHPRRLKSSILQERNKTESNDHEEVIVEEFTLDSLRRALGIKATSLRREGGGGSQFSEGGISPFPVFDAELLPHYATLVRGIPGAFAQRHRAPSSSSPWELNGPLLNVDLKAGPHLTRDRLLRLAERLHVLGLEDSVAVCVTADGPPSSSSPDLLEVLHRHNRERRHNLRTEPHARTLPLTLVLRDLVPRDRDVERIRDIVEVRYPESVRALVPSFKFSEEWYRGIRERPNAATPDATPNGRELWRLPMTVWTIDSRDDYDAVSSMVTGTAAAEGEGRGAVGVSAASAVIANRPMELIS